MKLYELPRGSFFKIEGVDGKFLLHNIDGMYSYCTHTFTDEVVHITAYTEVIKIDP